jgi:hypothetical protein
MSSKTYVLEEKKELIWAAKIGANILLGKLLKNIFLHTFYPLISSSVLTIQHFTFSVKNLNRPPASML